jgi:phage tail-like protein
MAIGISPAVSMRPTAGVGSSGQRRSKDEHIGLRFWVQLGQVEVAGFAECSGLQVETEVYEYAEGGLNTYTHKLPVRAKYKNITLKRGLDETRDLYSWYIKAMNGQIERQSISIIVYDSTGKQVQKWDLQRAFPSKWIGPNLTTERGAVAEQTLEIAHEGLLPGGK